MRGDGNGGAEYGRGAPHGHGSYSRCDDSRDRDRDRDRDRGWDTAYGQLHSRDTERQPGTEHLSDSMRRSHGRGRHRGGGLDEEEDDGGHNDDGERGAGVGWSQRSDGMNVSMTSTGTQDVEAVLAATADLLARTRQRLGPDGDGCDAGSDEHDGRGGNDSRGAGGRGAAGRSGGGSSANDGSAWEGYGSTAQLHAMHQQQHQHQHQHHSPWHQRPGANQGSGDDDDGSDSPPPESAEDLIQKLRSRLQSLPRSE